MDSHSEVPGSHALRLSREMNVEKKAECMSTFQQASKDTPVRPMCQAGTLKQWCVRKSAHAQPTQASTAPSTPPQPRFKRNLDATLASASHPSQRSHSSAAHAVDWLSHADATGVPPSSVRRLSARPQAFSDSPKPTAAGLQLPPPWEVPEHPASLCIADAHSLVSSNVCGGSAACSAQGGLPSLLSAVALSAMSEVASPGGGTGGLLEVSPKASTAGLGSPARAAPVGDEEMRTPQALIQRAQSLRTPPHLPQKNSLRPGVGLESSLKPSSAKRQLLFEDCDMLGVSDCSFLESLQEPQCSTSASNPWDQENDDSTSSNSVRLRALLDLPLSRPPCAPHHAELSRKYDHLR